MPLQNKKNLGQNWLKDRATLSHVADCADLRADDVVLEIGPGLGTLTSVLLRRAGKVVAVEFDSDLARKLPAQFPGKNLEVINQDILEFDLSNMPSGYKVVANVPYYITSKIIHMLMTASNRPSVVVLLVQKEVAERLSAKPGEMSVLAISAQVYADISLGDVIPAHLFLPPPKVDSQVVIMKTRERSLIPDDITEKDFFRVVKAGFSAKRKKLRSSLAGGLGLSKDRVEQMLSQVNIDPGYRAEYLSIEDWVKIEKIFEKIGLC